MLYALLRHGREGKPLRVSTMEIQAQIDALVREGSQRLYYLMLPSRWNVQPW